MGLENGEGFGVISGVGDLNGDGFGEVLVGAPANQEGGVITGKATLFDGKSGATLAEYLGTTEQESLGIVSRLGDVTGDGIPEFLIGAPQAWTDMEAFLGRVDVINGKSLDVVYSVWGELRLESFGAVLARMDDIDGDTFPEFIVGSPSWDGGGHSVGKATVFSGASGTMLYYLPGESACDRFGDTVSAADTNADGFADIVVGAELSFINESLHGRDYIYSGANGQLLITYDGALSSDGAGHTVAGMGDLDADGFDEIALSRTNSNQILLISGATSSVMESIQIDDALHSSFSNVGDVNGDGFEDLVIQDTSVGLNEAILVSGRTRGVLYRFHKEGLKYGGDAGWVGDVNNDGFLDIGVGDRTFEEDSPGGRAYVYAGNDLFLQAESEIVEENGVLQLHTRGAEPFTMVFLDLVALNAGFGFQVRVAQGLSDEFGNWTYEIPIPDGFAGQEFSFQSWSIRPKPERNGAGVVQGPGDPKPLTVVPKGFEIIDTSTATVTIEAD